MAMTLGTVIRNRRLELNISQREIGRRVGKGLSHSAISQIESGIERPSIRILKILSRELDLDYNYLLALNEDISDEPDIRLLRKMYYKLDSSKRLNFVMVLSENFPEEYRSAVKDEAKNVM